MKTNLPTPIHPHFLSLFVFNVSIGIRAQYTPFFIQGKIIGRAKHGVVHCCELVQSSLSETSEKTKIFST